MRLKYRVSLAVISILMVMTLFVSSSYALWSVTVTQQTENIIQSGCFDIDIESVGASINLDNTYPMSDDKGKKLQPYVFKVKNTCSVDATYTLYLSELSDNGGTAKAAAETQNLSDYIKVSLTKGNGAVITTQKLSEVKASDEAKNLIKVSDIKDIQFEGKTIKNTYQIATGTLTGETDEKAGGEETFELRLWIDSTADNTVMEQTFEAGVSAIAYATDLTPKTETSTQES